MEALLSMSPAIERNTAKAGCAPWRGRAVLALKSAITVAVLAYCASRVDLRAAAETLATVPPSLALLSLIPFLLVPILGGLRWSIVLRGLGERGQTRALVVVFSVGMVCAQVLPSLAGDGLRTMLATRRGYGWQASLHSVVLERIGMVLGLLVLMVATRPLLGANLPINLPEWLAPTFLACGVGGLACLAFADRLPPTGWIRWTPWLRLAGATRALLSSRCGMIVLVVSVISNLNFVLAAYMLGWALGIRLTFQDWLAIIPLVTLATTLPISFGGWGIREGLLLTLLGGLGVAASSALVLSLLLGAFAAVAGVPGLLFWWLGRDADEPSVRLATKMPVAMSASTENRARSLCARPGLLASASRWNAGG